MPSETRPESNAEKVWTKPVIEDADVGSNTGHVFSAGIDNYEASNPTNYGPTS